MCTWAADVVRAGQFPALVLAGHVALGITFPCLTLLTCKVELIMVLV